MRALSVLSSVRFNAISAGYPSKRRESTRRIPNRDRRHSLRRATAMPRDATREGFRIAIVIRPRNKVAPMTRTESGTRRCSCVSYLRENGESRWTTSIGRRLMDGWADLSRNFVGVLTVRKKGRDWKKSVGIRYRRETRVWSIIWDERGVFVLPRADFRPGRTRESRGERDIFIRSLDSDLG